MILLSFLAGGSAVDAKSKDVNEELGAAAFDCLAGLFQASNSSGVGTSGPIDTENVPVFGHAVSVVLDGITDGPSIKVQLAAISTLDTMILNVSDEEALRNFFPGMVSSLTKVLQPRNQKRRSYKILATSLQTLSKILTKVTGDGGLSNSTQDAQERTGVVRHGEKQADPWIKATSAQVKLALANIIPLRYHERSEVQDSLFELCISILRHCQISLAESAAMMIETLMAIGSHDLALNASKKLVSIKNLFSVQTSLMETLRASLHDWVVALPRIMQSNNDSAKRRSIEQISASFSILAAQNMNSDILNDTMTSSLRASVSVAIHPSLSQVIAPVAKAGGEVTRVLRSTMEMQGRITFAPILMTETGHKETLAGLQLLVKQLRVLPLSKALERSVVETLRATSGDEQLGNLWLSIQLLDDAIPEDSDMDRFLEIPADLQYAQSNFLDDVYSFSLDVLSKPSFDEEIDWRLQALALEILALQARQQKFDFCPELVDALYPIVDRIGSSNEALQEHAMTCLNIVSKACGYSSSSDLIIDNVDYLVNAVALKLNTFEISPQAPQVLLMMVKLCGAALIPYLDDLVESVFSVLACFHGYPRLVESLFSVLNAIVEEGSKSAPLAIESDTKPKRHEYGYQPISIAELSNKLKIARVKAQEKLNIDPNPSPINPQVHDSDLTTKPPEDEAATPQSKTHQMILSIATLTQHHLTTPSPPIRLQLLHLLSTSTPLLSTHPSTFLPLIATLFPPLLLHLHDPSSPNTLIAAANTLSTICEHAGSFLAPRFEDEWEDIMALYARVEGMRLREKPGRVRGSGFRMWEALVGLVGAIVGFVGVGPEMEDGVFEMLGRWVGWSGEVRDVLVQLNADRVWEVEERARVLAGGERLVVPGREFVELGF